MPPARRVALRTPRCPAAGRARTPRRRAGRPDRRRVRVGADRPGLARGSGAHPRIRLDRHPARRRRQRRAQRRRARRVSGAGRAGRPRRARTARPGVVPARRRHPPRRPSGRLSHAGEDAHPRRRHPFGQAAGRAHRPLRPRSDRRAVAPGVAARGAPGAGRRRRGAGVRLRLGAGVAGPGRGAGQAAASPAGDASPSWWTRATSC